MNNPSMRRVLALVALFLLAAPLALLGFNLEPAAPVRAAPQAATWHVSTLTDSNSSNPSCTNPCSLRQAIADAANGDTIDFPGLSGTIPLALGTLTVTQSITLTGPGSTNLAVSGSNLARVFAITGLRVTISGLTIRDGNAGALNGGGIYLNSSSFLTLTNSTVVSNTASGGGGIFTDGTLVVSNTLLTGNLGVTGTAIEIGYALSLWNSSVISNVSTADASTVYNLYTSNPVKIMSSSIISNTGNGIVSNGPLTIISSTIAYNTTTMAIQGGAGLYAGNYLTITSSTIDHNTAAAGSGAGIETGSIVTMTLNNVTISNNRAPGVNAQGGGLEFDGTVGDLNNVTIIGNSSTAGGGVLVGFGSLINMQNTIIALNTAGFGPDCSTIGTLNSQDYNLIGSTKDCTVGGSIFHNQSGDPKVTPLAWLGGPTQVYGLRGGSPALNAGNGSTCLSTDQRGVARPVPGTCDIGAFEGTASALYLPLLFR